MEEKRKTKDHQQDFIVETPIIIEEKLGKTGDKIRRYERLKFLGKGGFAKCYEMRCIDTKKTYAAKVFEKKALNNERSRKKLINEIKLHKKLHHQNIVNFEHFFEDKDNVYILLELCTNQTLNEILKRRKRLTEIEVQCYLIQIIKALKYIHSHKIIHRDLKLGNCFITSKLELKLGDFGLAAKLEYDGQRRRTVCGTPNYIAPEILEKKNGHSFEVDVWSLGVVAYTLIYGKPPFETSDVKLTYKKIKMNNYSYPDGIKVHPSARKLISSILTLDPSKRPSLDAILEHEFFKLYNSVPVLLPTSTLACPPSQKYVQQFLKSEANQANSNLNFNNTFSNLHFRYNSHHNVQNNYNSNNDVPNELNNANINMNSGDNLKVTNISTNDPNLLNRLLYSSTNALHRKSESLNNFNNLDLANEVFVEKVNQILQSTTERINSGGSRNINKNEMNVGSIDKIPKHLTKEELKEIFNSNNVVNNNYFINAGNMNKIELKLDENALKKLEECGINFKSEQLNMLINSTKDSTVNIKNMFNDRISKYYDFTNKFGYVYFINNTHLCVCFNDYSNLIKNVALNSDFIGNKTDREKSSDPFYNKNFTYIYIEKDGKNTLNFDETGFENFMKTNKTSAKDLVKKFDIFKHILPKYCSEVLLMPTSGTNSYMRLFFVKKFLKVQHAVLFRLSNKLIQVSFVDKAELIMSTEANDFYYKSKNDEEQIDSIQNAMNSDNQELIKRIKYAKNLLIHFVKNQKSKKLPK